MHKVKKAIADLKMYLGSDSHGKDLLERVSHAADEIRKNLAAKSAECERLREEKQSQWTPDALLRECETLREDVRQVTDQLAQSRSRIAILERQLADALTKPERPKVQAVVSGNRIVDIASKARLQKPLPPLCGYCRVKDVRYKSEWKGHDPSVCLVNDVVSKKATDEELWYLGATAFLMTNFLGTVVFHSTDRIKDYVPAEADRVRIMREIYGWLRNNASCTYDALDRRLHEEEFQQFHSALPG